MTFNLEQVIITLRPASQISDREDEKENDDNFSLPLAQIKSLETNLSLTHIFKRLSTKVSLPLIRE